MAELPPDPGHPEPHTMRWTEAELRAIREYGRAAQQKAVEAAAKAVEQHDRTGREWVPTSFWGTLSREASARVRALIPTPDGGGAS